MYLTFSIKISSKISYRFFNHHDRNDNDNDENFLVLADETSLKTRKKRNLLCIRCSVLFQASLRKDRDHLFSRPLFMTRKRTLMVLSSPSFA